MNRILMTVLCVILGAMAAAGEAKPLLTFGPWQPVEPGGKPLDISYCNLLSGAKGGIELWFDANVGGTDHVIGLAGPDPGALVRTLPRFGAGIVNGYDADLRGRKTPIISRSQTTRLADGRLVTVAAIGPEYGAGGTSTELWPALFVSPDGAPGTWKHLGPPAGPEVETELKRARASGSVFRFEGGSLHQRPDGSLVLFCGWNPGPNGARVAMIGSPSLEGPWSFRRDKNGRMTDLAAKLPGGWLFPAVHDLGPRGLLLCGGDQWPPKRIDGAISTNAAVFMPLPAPLITAGQILPDSTSVKTLRLLYRADTDTVLAIANPHRKGGPLMYPLMWAEGTFTTPKPKYP